MLVLYSAQAQVLDDRELESSSYVQLIIVPAAGAASMAGLPRAAALRICGAHNYAQCPRCTLPSSRHTHTALV